MRNGFPSTINWVTLPRFSRCGMFCCANAPSASEQTTTPPATRRLARFIGNQPLSVLQRQHFYVIQRRTFGAIGRPFDTNYISWTQSQPFSAMSD